jgi:hypothetical protein
MATGDIEIKSYRKAIKKGEQYLKDDRAHFESQLARLGAGYVSVNTLDDFNLGRTLGKSTNPKRILSATPRSVMTLPNFNDLQLTCVFANLWLLLQTVV